MGTRVGVNITLIAIALCLYSCTSPFIPDDDGLDREYVVEGYITAGNDAIPPHVIVTQTLGFAQEVTVDDVAAVFVNDAIVTVEHEGEAYELTAICEVPDVLRPLAESYLGFDPSTIDGEVCIYVDLLQRIPTKELGVYDLSISIPDVEIITATTTIPRAVPVDSLWWIEPPGEPSDTLARLNSLLSDPPGPDFYRYEVNRNGGPFYAPFTSTTNDLLFAGQQFEIPINNVSIPGEDRSPDEFGLFNVGDTIVLRWLTLDEAHFDFWQTRDFNANNVGPFASYTRVSSNVDGALGNWGGYYEYLYELVVEN